MPIWEKEWWTGRSEKEADVYANFEKVDTVVTNIKNIKTKQVIDAQEAVQSAINDLNNVNGVAKHVGTISVNSFDECFEGIGTIVEDIANQLQQKAEDIKIYAEATDDQKAASTAAMLFTKAGEGFLSVLEDLGDTAFSVMGWTSGKLAAIAGAIDKKNKDEYKKAAETIQDAFANVIDKEWSHDVFNFYYNSDFAKMSDITEEGGTAKLAKLAGEIGGYYVTGSAITKAFTASEKLVSVASKGAKALGKIADSAGTVGKVAKTVFNASKATYGNAALIGATSYGSHTESNLRQGLDFDTSVRKAAGSALKDAGLAFAIGRGLEAGGEYIQTKEVQVADANAKGASEILKAEENLNNAKKGLEDAERELAGAKTAKSMAEADVESGLSASEAGLPKAEIDLSIAEQNVARQKGLVSEAEKTLQAAEKANPTVANRLKAETQLKAATEDLNNAKKGLADAEKELAGAKTAKSMAEADVESGLSASEAGLPKAEIDLSIAEQNVARQRGLVAEAESAVSSAEKAVTAAGVQTTKSAIIPAAESAFGGINKTVDEANAAKQIALNNNDSVTRPLNNVTGASGDAGVINPPTGNSGTSTGVDPVVGDGYQPPNGDVDNGGGGNGNVQLRDTGGSNYTPSVNPPSGATNPGATNPGTTGGGNSDTSPGTTGGGNQTSPGTGTPTQPSDSGTGVDNGPSNTQPTTPTNPSDGSSNNPTNPPQSGTTPSDNPPNDETTQHSGGGYTGTGGYTPAPADNGGNNSGGYTATDHSGNSSGGYTATSNGGRYYGGGTSGETITTPPENIDQSAEEVKSSIDEIVKGSKYTKIPTATTPITTKKSSGGSAVIPIAAGLSAAAAAGIGAKAYMDKKNADSYDDEDEYNDEEEWTGDEDTIEIAEEDTESDAYLDDDDDYGYQTEEVEKYGARSTEELADLQ